MEKRRPEHETKNVSRSVWPPRARTRRSLFSRGGRGPDLRIRLPAPSAIRYPAPRQLDLAEDLPALWGWLEPLDPQEVNDVPQDETRRALLADADNVIDPA